MVSTPITAIRCAPGSLVIDGIVCRKSLEAVNVCSRSSELEDAPGFRYTLLGMWYLPFRRIA